MRSTRGNRSATHEASAGLVPTAYFTGSPGPAGLVPTAYFTGSPGPAGHITPPPACQSAG